MDELTRFKNIVAKAAGAIVPPADAKALGICVFCGPKELKFRDETSKREYSITAMCQECQDKVFNSMEE
jgi:hypothetical protein